MKRRMEPQIQTPALRSGGAARPVRAHAVTSHHPNNYGGAVRRLNAIRAQLGCASIRERAGLRAQRPEARGADRGQLDAAARAVLRQPRRRRRRWPPVLEAGLARAFGSVERWRDEFVALGRGARRRLGLGAARLVAARGARWSTSGPPTTRTRWPARHRCSRSTCTSMPITSTTAPTRPRMSMPSCINSHWAKRRRALRARR